MIKDAFAASYDVCVIGSGPAGLTAAIELADQGLSVALVESGEQMATNAAQRLSDAQIVTTVAHSVMGEAVWRGLGGTSNIWGGRCVPLDAIDFLRRDFVTGSGWPFDETALQPHYPRACAILDAGQANFSINDCASAKSRHVNLSTNFADTDQLRATELERWCTEPKLWIVHKDKVITHPLITVLAGLTCVGFEQTALHAAVDTALLKTTSSPESFPIKLHAKFIVLACGGVETTRLVLNSIRDATGLKLTSNGLVGRYYMGHPSGKIADIQLTGNPSKTLYGFEVDDGVYVRRRITFRPDCLQKHELLNIAFWLDNAPISDWRHGSGVLSAAYLALTAPVIGRFLAPAAIRKRVGGGAGNNRLRHLVNCARSPIKTLGFCFRFCYQRYLAKPRIPGFFTYSANNRYALHYHGEQVPNWNSTIDLSDEVDAVGLRRARINLKWSTQDVDSIIKAHAVLDEALQVNGVGRLIYRYPKDELAKTIHEQAVDGFHQIGTLRMGVDASTGVTDSFGRLFGTSNCFVASSAIFPTSGQANPTLPIVALTVRQAKHIAQLLNTKEFAGA
jgi:hypothetical protein